MRNRFVSVVLVASLSAWLASLAAQGAPCCAPKKWAAEVRLITMENSNTSYTQKKTWYWISYDYDKQLVAVITFDFFHADVYQRELLDYAKGVRYVTPDEFKCWSKPLKTSLPRLCVPPQGGNITMDMRMLFGFYDHRVDNGWFAETIFYQDDDVTGHVTVTSLTCSFVNEMTYAKMDDGNLLWQHTQWNNITLTVDPENFHMPSSCNMSVTTPPPSQDLSSFETRIGVLSGLFE